MVFFEIFRKWFGIDIEIDQSRLILKLVKVNIISYESYHMHILIKYGYNLYTSYKTDVSDGALNGIHSIFGAVTI